MNEGMADSAHETIRNLVSRRITELGLNMSDVSKRLGKNPTYIQQYIRKKSPQWLPEEIRPTLASILNMDQSALQRTSSINHRQEPTGVPIVQPLHSMSDPSLLKVLGMAECGPDGWALFNGDVVDRVPRPPNLANVKDAYAVFITGDSMEDRYHEGEIAHIHPGKPVTPGAYVLVQKRPKIEGDTPLAVIKRLVKRTGDKVILEQLNPRERITVLASDIVSMHRVVGSSEA